MAGITFFFLSPGKEKPNNEGLGFLGVFLVYYCFIKRFNCRLFGAWMQSSLSTLLGWEFCNSGAFSEKQEPKFMNTGYLSFRI